MVCPDKQPRQIILHRPGNRVKALGRVERDDGDMIGYVIEDFVRLGLHRTLGLGPYDLSFYLIDLAAIVLYSSQRSQDNLRRQRNFRDDCPKRPERIVDRVGYGRRRTCRTGLSCSLRTQFRFQGR